MHPQLEGTFRYKANRNVKKMAHFFWGCRRDALSTVNMEETNGRDPAFFQSGKLLYSF